MSSSNLTMIGMYNYDSTIFDGLTFPAGIDKTIAVDEIITRCGEFEILYPNLSFLKSMIEHWGKKHYRTFEKCIDDINIDFEPLYNYDRFEEYTDEKVANGSVSAKVNGSISSTANSVDNSSETENASDRSNSESQTATNSTSSDTDTRSVSAYDSNDYQPREQEIKSNTSGQTGNGAAQNESSSESAKTANSTATSEQNTKNNSEQNTESNNVEQSKHTAHLFGNIGVTTSTQMLEDYIRVERFNIYEQIADIFVDEFCLMVY